MGSRLCVMMYHCTRDLRHSHYPRVKGLDLPLFREQLDFFQKRFHVVTMEQVIDVAGGGTLDDGESSSSSGKSVARDELG